MGANLRTKETIVQGESEGKSFYEIIEASHTFGWRTFDHACLDAYKKGIVTEDTAILFSSKRGVVTRGIDMIKKTRGEQTSNISDLRMTPQSEKSMKGPPAIPLTLKVK
jgi:twitching motility protein PilT